MKKAAVAIVAGLLYITVAGAATSPGKPSDVLNRFFRAFEKKDFKNASKFLSSTDAQLVSKFNQHVKAQAQMKGISIKDYTVEDFLAQNWKDFYDKEQKKKTLQQLKEQMLRNAHGINMEEFEKRFKLLWDISINSTFNPFSGKVIKEVVKGNYAVVVGDAYFEYDKGVTKKAKDFYNQTKRQEHPEKAKYTYWKGNQYHFPVVFYLVKEKGGWKVMHFTRSGFPFKQFAEVLKVFDPEVLKPRHMMGGHPPIK